MTKLSIIIPYRNVEQYISKCLSTVLYQTLDDIEVICVNDASEDASENIVKEYANTDKRVISLNTFEESGQSYARNLGLEVASGEYIGFVDADDWVELDMFEKLYTKAKATNSDITMCRAKLYDDKTQEFYTNDYYALKCLEKFGDETFSAIDSKDEILNINVVLWNKIYKKEYLDKLQVKFAEGFIYEDMPFFFETYIKAQRINILWEDLYYYRQNRTFSTMQKSNKKVYDRIDMAELTYNVLKQAPFFQEKQADILRWLVDDIFHRYTLLDDIYYEEYYRKMREFFINLDLDDEKKKFLETSYCYDEFCNILERDYFGFWNFLIEKYKTSNKRIKAAEHKCNEDISAIKDYIEQYKAEVAEEKDKIVAWWKDYTEKEIQHRIDEQFTFLESKKSYEMKQLYNEFEEKLKTQENDLRKWQIESLRQQKEKLTADFEWKFKEQKRRYQEQEQRYQQALIEQKNYYENNYLLVKIMLKAYKKLDQVKNKIKKVFKKN